jgi:plastocyanin
MRITKNQTIVIGSAIILTLSMISSTAWANDILVKVVDTSGAVVQNAVVYAEAKTKSSSLKSPAIIEQRGRKFNPLVSVVQSGSDISFPNFDSVRHHVYSFSPAKKFELKLYSGVPANPVNFDKAGTVVLGCNIHDFMLAFIHVVDTPYFAKTDATGHASLKNLPAGNYTLKTWHYALAKENVVVEKSLSVSSNQDVVVELALKPFELPSQP